MFVYVCMYVLFYVCAVWIAFVDLTGEWVCTHMTEFWAGARVRLEAKFDRPEVTLCGLEDAKIH